jgi:hypothetical protein
VWTGFDYLGEPTPFERQAKSSYFGIVDLCGIPKDRFYLYRSHWRPDTTTVHLLPHWNWPERVEKPVPVFVYTNGDEAELFVNGKSQGRRTKGAVPPAPDNFAKEKPVQASSLQRENPPAAAVDGDQNTRWSAASSNSDQWLEIDLGQEQPLKCFVIDFEREAKNYAYTIETSRDHAQWKNCVTQSASNEPQWGGPRTAIHDVDVAGRFVRIRFNELRAGAWASLREFRVCPQHAEASYYDVTYDYRLRWNDVIYEPGMLEAIAYKGGKRIGTATVQTAGPPESLRLTADRHKLDATGDDLAYILVEAVDKDGNLCPLEANGVHFEIEGPGEIAGVGNGDPLSTEPFQSQDCKLFFGKAMLVLRAAEGQNSDINVAASSAEVLGDRIRIERSKP